jgi:hypothetical protein
MLEEVERVAPEDLEDLVLVDDRALAGRAVLAVVDRPIVVATSVAAAVPLAADEVPTVAAADDETT